MDNLSLVPLRNGLAQDARRVEIRVKICERIIALGLNLATYRNSSEMLLLICNMLETTVSKRDKIDKKALCLEILDQLFTLTLAEKASTDSNIEFLWSNKSIRAVSYWKLFCAGCKELFFKKK